MRDVKKKKNVKMNINFAEDTVRRRLDVVAPRLGVASVYETKPWTFLQQGYHWKFFLIKLEGLGT